MIALWLLQLHPSCLGERGTVPVIFPPFWKEGKSSPRTPPPTTADICFVSLAGLCLLRMQHCRDTWKWASYFILNCPGGKEEGGWEWGWAWATCICRSSFCLSWCHLKNVFHWSSSADGSVHPGRVTMHTNSQAPCLDWFPFLTKCVPFCFMCIYFSTF